MNQYLLALSFCLFFSCSKKNQIFIVDPSSNIPESFFVQLGAITNFKNGDNSGMDGGSDITVDSSGNIYISGFTTGNFAETNAGERDAYIMKVNSRAEIQWITQLGATTNFGQDNAGMDICTDIEVDKLGNVYCSGKTTGNLGEVNAGNNDAFVLKLNKNGQLQWITQLGETTRIAGGSNTGDDSFSALAIDDNGDILCVGNTDGDVAEANGGEKDALVVKFNSEGQLLWGVQFGATTVVPNSSNAGRDILSSIKLDSNGNIYVAGNTNGSFAEDNGGGGYNDMFAMKLNSTGALQWATQLGAITKAEGWSNTGGDSCNDMVLDKDNNVICIGYTGGAMGEGDGGGADSTIVKLNNDGVLQWVTQLGNTTTIPGGENSQNDYCYAGAVDSTGNIYCIGSTKSNYAETNAGDYDLFILKLDSAGNLLNLIQFGEQTAAENGDNSAWDAGTSISIDTTGSIYFSGTTYGAMGETNGGSLSGDIFFAKLKHDLTL